MPLPEAPTRRPNNPGTRRADSKANSDLLIKGILCAFIGLAVLLAPYFITSPDLRGMVAKSALIGWFALLLGCAFIGVHAWRRLATRAGP